MSYNQYSISMAALSLGYTPGNKPLYGRLDSKFKSHEITENYS